MSKQKTNIAYIIGTRPEIIRSADLIRALASDETVEFKLVHTGQHYDYEMSEVFFKQLDVPMPDLNLGVGSGKHGAQTAKMMIGLEDFFLSFQPDIVGIFGDTNSSLAGALVAAKLGIPIAHLEAGCREWDMRLPEEMNRRIIDHMSNVAFAFSRDAMKNLKDERVLAEVYNTGDPLFEVFEKNLKESATSDIRDRLGVTEGEYFFATIHRAGNVGNLDNFRSILDGLSAHADKPIIFPIHPHSKKQLEKLNYPAEKLVQFMLIDPIPYMDLLHLVAGAEMVVTDSGGLQKEVFWAKIPCITLRDITAWSETVDLGVNFLAGFDSEKIGSAIAHIRAHRKEIDAHFASMENPYYKPDTTGMMVNLLKKHAGKRWME